LAVTPCDKEVITHEVLNKSGSRQKVKKVKKVKIFRNFHPVYYKILTFFAPVLEVFLHFIFNNKIDNQYIIMQKNYQNQNFSKIITFCHTVTPSACR
jgi:hypothetical protein